MVVNLIIFLQIKSSTGYLEKYSKILNVLFDFLKKNLNVFWQNIIIICFSKILVSKKSKYSLRSKVNMALLLLINASRNLQFLFFYITWRKLRVSFQSQNSLHEAPQISIRFRNPNSIFHFVNINTYPSNIYLLVQNYRFVIFF